MLYEAFQQLPVQHCTHLRIPGVNKLLFDGLLRLCILAPGCFSQYPHSVEYSQNSVNPSVFGPESASAAH